MIRLALQHHLVKGDRMKNKQIWHANEDGELWQDDIVHEDLTVRENLAYSAKLRCIATEDRAYLSDVVDDVIELLGLRHVQHSVVGSVEKRGVR